MRKPILTETSFTVKVSLPAVVPPKTPRWRRGQTRQYGAGQFSYAKPPCFFCRQL